MLLPGNPPSGSDPNTTAKGGTWSSQSASRAFAVATVSLLGKLRANDSAVALFLAMKQVNTNGGALSRENDDKGPTPIATRPAASAAHAWRPVAMAAGRRSGRRRGEGHRARGAAAARPAAPCGEAGDAADLRCIALKAIVSSTLI